MFKRLLIGSIVALLLVVGVAGFVFAQTQEPPEDAPTGVCPFNEACPLDEDGEHPMWGGGHMRGGMMHDGYGHMGAMPALLAEALDMTLEELTEALAEGQTLTELIEAQGMEVADVAAALSAPHVETIEGAVEDGTLTQAQADAMLEQMEGHHLQMLEDEMEFPGGMRDYDEGGCPMHNESGFRGGMHGRRGRWGNMAPQRLMPRWNAPQS